MGAYMMKVAEAQKCVAALDVDKDGDFSSNKKVFILKILPVNVFLS